MTRWAILGTGMVAHKFVSDLRHASPQMGAVAVASRNFANAQALAEGHEGLQPYESFEAAVQAADVDAVYIATPPSVHEEQALMAIGAGKAVLIEKPFATDAASAQRIADAARAAGVFCMEAMWTRFLPLLEVVRNKLKSNDIGELRSLSGSFGISSFPDASDSLFDPTRGGGALLHRGIYPLSLAYHLMGPVVDMNVSGRLGETGVDEDISLILRHENGGLSSLSASLRAPGPNDLTIGGTHGMMRLVKPVYRPFVLETARATPRKSGAKAGRLGRLRESDLGQKLNQRLPDGLRNRLEKTSRTRAPYLGQGYHYQASEVARCLTAGQMESAVMPLSESVAIMELVDAAYQTLKQDS